VPPKCKFTREEVAKAALKITREKGISAVTARAVGAKLGSSPKVIFSLFKNMEELHMELVKYAGLIYQKFLQEDMSQGKYPPYKASGMAYIRFAKEEKELFKLLFMRDRSNEKETEDNGEVKPIIKIIQKNVGISEEQAYMFHLEMWVIVHGIATMVATNYLGWEPDLISKVLTDGYNGLKLTYQGGKLNGSNQNS
jgi:AcrR family transcriptional regulator